MNAPLPKITNRQTEILRLIKQRAKAKRPPPTGTELMLVCLAVDLAAVKSHMRHLRRAGLVDWQTNGLGFRALRLTPAGMAVAP